jgi:hypothetical protein
MAEVYAFRALKDGWYDCHSCRMDQLKNSDVRLKGPYIEPTFVVYLKEK